VAAPPFSPDDVQRQVIEHAGGALLVIGAAGTGKTVVLRERFARLIETGADPERTVLVVGSTRARDDARAFLLERLSTSLPGLQVLTMHGLAHRVLKERFAALGDDEPPAVLSAAEQFSKVRELLVGQDPTQWPAYGHLLGMRGFADEVRQFLLRAQEELWTPEAIEEAATARGLGGWQELARFLREYQAVLDGLHVVDFAGLLQRAAAAVTADGGPGPVDHILVDDYQDTTLAAEALLRGAQAGDVVVAANPEAHVFSFQGTTQVPLARFATETFPGARRVELVTAFRPAIAPDIEAWIAPHTSEEHAAIARELRRLHVDEGVAWRELAVVVRRQGPHVAGLLRALDDARIPRLLPERGLTLTAEPATTPYVLALRWLVADEAHREELIEPLLTSDVVGLSPAAARGSIRLARTTGPAPRVAADALARTDGLTPGEAEAVDAARRALDKAALFAGMSVQDTFKVLWEGLPCSARLVAEGGPNLDVVVTFANVVSEASEQGDASVEAFLEALDAGEHGPGWAPREAGGADAVRVLTAHGAAGLEFDTVLVAGAAEGAFPSLSLPEPMFDLAVLARARTRSEQLRDRLQDERRLFRIVLGRARRRAVLVAADTHPDAEELTQRSRFVDELGVAWAGVPGAGADEPVSVREAAVLWRRQLADPGVERWRRLAALDGLLALGVDPGRWWFTRDWTDTGRPLHETLRLSFSRLSTLENCELQHVLGDELGLGKPAGYQAWVGKLVHGIIEDIETGRVGKTKAEILAEVDARWRGQEFPSLAVATAYRRLVEDRMFKNWWKGYGESESLANERLFEFEFDGATIVGVIDRIGRLANGGTRITDFKTGNPDAGPKPEESLQLGIYYLAVQGSDDLAGFRPVRAVELAYLKGHWKNGELVIKAWPISEHRSEAYQDRIRAQLSALIAEKRRLLAEEVYRPNPSADCYWCEFKTLCPLWSEGQPLFDVEAAR
jgi:superfamily I DNA/RNA helicase/RecB family exonuclease